MKEITVLVPVYNMQHYIARCIRSLLSQSFSKNSYEIITIDDGSTDDSGKIIDQFIDPKLHKVRKITNGTNLGLPASLNKAIYDSDSKYIVRVDADDFVNFHFLNILYEFAEQNEDKAAVACDYLLVDDEENVIRRCSAYEDPIACGILFRRTALKSLGGYDEKFRAHEDKEFRVRFDQKYSMAYASIPMYRYRRHRANMTNDLDSMALHLDMLQEKHPQSS